MKFMVSGKNIDITTALRERAVKKMKKIEKFFSPDTEANVTMSVQKARQIIEVTIYYCGVVFRAEVASEDMYASIDKAIDILERQIRKNKTRLEKKLHKDAFKEVKGDSAADVNDGLEYDEEHEEYHIVKSKKFAIKPMAVEEAILQMNLLHHEFFVFSNSETKEVNVVYKRKDKDYGLIEPEF
jgi:putative sigma-54 modulation protein